MHGKISPAMYTGSMVGAGAMAFALMPYAIANARPDEGCTVDLNPTVLAAVFGESIDSVKAAITYLCSPDPHSRSPDEEGRRLVQCGPGPYRYRVVNLAKYREDAKGEHRRAYWAAYRKWERGGKNGEFVFTVNKVNKSELFNSVHGTDAGTDADAGTGTKTVDRSPGLSSKKFQKPTLEMVKLQCAKVGLPEAEAVHFWNYHESKGWVVGRAPMRSWPSALVTWKCNWEKRAFASRFQPQTKSIADQDADRLLKRAEKFVENSNRDH